MSFNPTPGPYYLELNEGKEHCIELKADPEPWGQIIAFMGTGQHIKGDIKDTAKLMSKSFEMYSLLKKLKNVVPMYNQIGKLLKEIEK